MIKDRKAHGPAVAPESFYVQQATVGQALSELKTSLVVALAMVAFYLVCWAIAVIANEFLGITTWASSLVEIKISSKGKAILGCGYFGWLLYYARSKGFGWKQTLVAVSMNAFVVLILSLLPSALAGPVSLMWFAVIMALASAWDNLRRVGRENFDRIAQLERNAASAQAELAREWKAQAGRAGW